MRWRKPRCGGVWGGCVYDVEAVAEKLLRR